ncbi:MAG: PAS domain-containing protein [Methylomicrobium sp.]|nr:PAS domain-containing protein [Methylomicrobium sp.]
MSVVEKKADDPMIIRAMDKGKFVRVNDSFKAKVGFDASELAEKPFLDWIDPRDRSTVQAAFENDERLFFARHITRDGNTLQLQIQLAEHENGPFLLGRCAKLPSQLESEVARSAEASVLGTLDAIARIIEEQNPGYKCSILLVADGRFVFGAGPSLPEDYNSAVNGYAIGPTVGSCGTAIFWNTPVIVEDIQADPLWAPLSGLAKKAGVAACWSHPFVSSSGKVLGALALYSPEPRAPTTEQFSLLRAAARITGLAVERGRAEEALKRADESIKVVRNQLQATLNALPDLLFEVDSEGRIFRYHSYRADPLAASHEEFMGKRFADVMPPDAAGACQRAIDEAAQKGFSYGEIFRLTLPQGEHWFELSIAPLHSDAKSNQRFVMISRDITERKLNERKLQQRDQYQRALLDNFPFAVWLKDTENRFLAVNAGFVTLFGARSAEELVGKTDFDIAPAELAEGYRADDRAVLSSGRKKNVEEEIIDADGTRKWFETYKASVLDDTGRVVGTVGFARDITERRAAAQALQDMSAELATSRDLLQQVIDTAPIRVFWKDREGRYLGCNPAFARDAGKNTPSELIGRDDFAMGWAAQAEWYRTDDQVIMQTGQPRLNFEEPQITPDGKQIRLRTSKVPLYDRQGEIIGILGIYDDITQQKREERRLALALDASKILIWEMDFTTGKLDYDGSAMIGLGLDKADAPDTLEGWLVRVHSDDRTRFTENVEQALRQDDTRGFDYEYRFGNNTGGYHWLQTTGRVVQRDVEGHPLLMAGYSVNIDERKLAEAELERYRQHLEELVQERTEALTEAKLAAEASSRAKTAFLANMSHELRTPMNGVLGMLDLAKRRMTDVNGLDQLDKAKQSAQRLLGVLNDILDISKIEAGRMVFESVPLEIFAVVEGITSTLGHKATGKGLRLTTDLAADLKRQPLKGDPLRLGQILLNLVGNAIKFTQKGTVTLLARSVGETPEAVQVRFEVSDTGIGIDSEAQARLFQSFEQADNSMTRKYGGTGLGLAISKRLVTFMDGQIGVESRPGLGSTFWFVVPLKKREPSATPTPTSVPKIAEERLQTEFVGTPILLAEDEPISQEVSRFLLEHIGLVVDVAEDGQQALAMACRNTYALILMDMQMPRMNGIEATQAIRADSLNTMTPILAMTANAYDEDRETCLAAGMNEHISKPVDPEKLYETLLALLVREST